MAFYPVNFQPLGIDASPLMSMNLAQQYLGNMIKNQYAPQEYQQDIQRQQLANSLAGVNLQYAPQMNAADLAVKLAQPNLIKAQTNLANTEALWEPTKEQAAYYAGMGRYLTGNYYNQPTTSLSRVINSPSMEGLIQSNPQVGSAVTQALGGIAGRAGNGAQSVPTISFQNGTPVLSGVPGQQPATPPIQITPQDVSNVQDASGSSLIRKTTTAQIMNQQLYDQSADQMMQQAATDLPDIVKYAGASNFASLMSNRLKGALGFDTDPDYQKYYNFTRVQIPAIANEIRRQLGGQATNHETYLMTSITNPFTWDSNPKLAASQFKELMSVAGANRIALAKSANQIRNAIRSQVSNNTDDPLGLRQ